MSKCRPLECNAVRWNTVGPRNDGDGIGEAVSMLNKQHEKTIEMDERVRGKTEIQTQENTRFAAAPQNGSLLYKHRANHMESDDDIQLPMCIPRITVTAHLFLLHGRVSSAGINAAVPNFLFFFFFLLFSVLALRPEEPANNNEILTMRMGWH